MRFQQCPSPDLQFQFRFYEEPLLVPALIDLERRPSSKVLHRFFLALTVEVSLEPHIATVVSTQETTVLS